MTPPAVLWGGGGWGPQEAAALQPPPGPPPGPPPPVPRMQVACRDGCGALYCCEACERAAWDEQHCLLCPGPASRGAADADADADQAGPSTSRGGSSGGGAGRGGRPGAPPAAEEGVVVCGVAVDRTALRAFYEHARETNDIFVLAAKVRQAGRQAAVLACFPGVTGARRGGHDWRACLLRSRFAGGQAGGGAQRRGRRRRRGGASLVLACLRGPGKTAACCMRPGLSRASAGTTSSTSPSPSHGVAHCAACAVPLVPFPPRLARWPPPPTHTHQVVAQTLLRAAAALALALEAEGATGAPPSQEPQPQPAPGPGAGDERHSPASSAPAGEAPAALVAAEAAAQAAAGRPASQASPGACRAALLAAWQPYAFAWKRAWWESVAVPDDVEDEEAFRLQLRCGCGRGRACTARGAHLPARPPALPSVQLQLRARVSVVCSARARCSRADHPGCCALLREHGRARVCAADA